MTVVDTRQHYVRSYTNYINFTQQANLQGVSYNSFFTPFSDNKIMIFTSGIYVDSVNQRSMTVDPNPVIIRVATAVHNSSFYSFTVEFGTFANLLRLHFSVIVYHQSCQSVQNFMFIQQKYDFTQSGKFISVPIQFTKNMIMGLTDFQTPEPIPYYITANGTYGIQMPPSILRDPFFLPANRFGFTLFYLKTWTCPNGTILNVETSLCSECLLNNCQQCSPCSKCLLCNTDRPYNLTQDGECQQPFAAIDISTFSGKITDVNCQNVFKASILSTVPFNESILDKIAFLNEGVQITGKQRANSSAFNIYGKYTKDLTDEGLALIFQTNKTINVSTLELKPLIFHEPEQCQDQVKIQKILFGVQIASYASLLMSILSCKIIGLELFGVLQISYFTLSSHSFMHTYLFPLTGFKTFNGLNLPFVTDSSQLNQKLKIIGFSGNFLNNCNIMLLLFYAAIIILFVAYHLAAKVINQKASIKLLTIFKQTAVSLTLFNIFNVAFSLGVHLRYANSSDPSYIPSTIIMILTAGLMAILILSMELTESKSYGEFKKKFKKNFVSQMYISLSFLYRFSLGVYIGYDSEYQESTLLILGIVILYLLYFGTNLPFKQPYQNYRAGIINLSIGIILYITNFYRSMKSTTSLSIKSHINFPAKLQIAIILTFLLVSFVCLIYEIYKTVKKCRKQKKDKQVQALTQSQILDDHLPTLEQQQIHK